MPILGRELDEQITLAAFVSSLIALGREHLASPLLAGPPLQRRHWGRVGP
jgi:hypothetical protein